MFQPLSLAIGLRYLRAKRRSGFLSFFSMASILGMALSVAALVATLSVMTGFQEELRSRILGMVAHATIEGIDGPLQNWQQAIDIAKKDPRVLGAAPYVEREAMIQAGRVQGAVIRGVLPDEEPKVSELALKMTHGHLSDLKPGAYNIILGKELALWLGVGVGDKVTVFVPELNTTPVGVLPKMRRFTVVGIFEAGAQEFDLGMALVHMQDAQRLTRIGDGVTGVRLKLTDLWNAWPVAVDLTRQMQGLYRVRDWTRDHENFFRALKMEKTMMFILLSLLVAIAAFNLVSSLVMLVQDKQADIAILRTIGLTPGGVMRVFIVQGMVIGVAGIVIGIVGGVLLSYNLVHVVHLVESITGSELMPADVYYISFPAPVIEPLDLLMIASLAFGLCLLATLYPAWRASRTDPAEALRHE
ncbi:MAG TPA: lipoprotein-releasing ABC transporter permease subunit [Arenimonas sp.]|uniref:lipoprotein-releasing ABC transporter permease subunit n=1 Tax=Arenimonas sp. TaxID=1872635 RepID=UPI002BFC80B0|nr:lipoprotein-releasing ABC transporter permease subunit [Arenimonas sp.]HMB57319.1 lipoprotein-releasing ABC transporter permease subunit [Arenimonas sp.]